MLLSDVRGRVLLVEPAYKDRWELPGGSVEAEESPLEAAVREIREELGLDIRPGLLLAIDWVPPGDGRTEGLMMVFDGGALGRPQTDLIRIPEQELLGWKWCTRREAAERLSPLLARRTFAAMDARAQKTTVYLENGNPTSFR